MDFYIRLGFHDEALAKLNDIAKFNPDQSRTGCRAIRSSATSNRMPLQEPEAFDRSDMPVFAESAETHPPEEIETLPELEVDGRFRRLCHNRF